MSRGPGKVQSAITEIFSNSKAKYLFMNQICKRIWPNEKIDRDKQKSVKRAARIVADRLGWKVMWAQCYKSENVYLSPNAVKAIAEESAYWAIVRKIHGYLKRRTVTEIKVRKLSKIELQIEAIKKQASAYMYQKLTPDQVRNIILSEIYDYLTDDVIAQCLKEAEIDMEEIVIETIGRNDAIKELQKQTYTRLIEDSGMSDDDKEDIGMLEDHSETNRSLRNDLAKIVAAFRAYS